LSGCVGIWIAWSFGLRLSIGSSIQFPNIGRATSIYWARTQMAGRGGHALNCYM
jgi:hypothetical protein